MLKAVVAQVTVAHGPQHPHSSKHSVNPAIYRSFLAKSPVYIALGQKTELVAKNDRETAGPK